MPGKTVGEDARPRRGPFGDARPVGPRPTGSGLAQEAGRDWASPGCRRAWWSWSSIYGGIRSQTVPRGSRASASLGPRAGESPPERVGDSVRPLTHAAVPALLLRLGGMGRRSGLTIRSVVGIRGWQGAPNYPAHKSLTRSHSLYCTETFSHVPILQSMRRRCTRWQWSGSCASARSRFGAAWHRTSGSVPSREGVGRRSRHQFHVEDESMNKSASEPGEQGEVVEGTRARGRRPVHPSTGAVLRR